MQTFIRKLTTPANVKFFVALFFIFLVSFTTLSYQIILQRTLSIILNYHFVFAIVSIALFGISLGGLCVFLLTPYINRFNSIYLLAILVLLFFGSVGLSFVLTILLGNTPLLYKNMLIYGTILIIPFFLCGVFISRIFYIYPLQSSSLYTFDLLGASFGCYLSIFILNSFGIRDSVYYIICIGFFTIGIILFIIHKKYHGSLNLLFPLLVLIIASFLFKVNIFNSFDFVIGVNPDKEIYDALKKFKGKIIDSQESAFGRIDVVQFEEYPELMDIYIDGTAGMPMYRFNNDYDKLPSAVKNLQVNFPGYFPLSFLNETEKKSAFIIGPGGGRDILLAEMAQVEDIVAVEVNKDLIQLVRKYSDFNGHILNNKPGFTLYRGEGRNYLKRIEQRFDIIMTSLPVTNTGQGLGNLALTENYLYTEEAMLDYLEHLTANGRFIAVTHNDLEVLRLLSITLSALQKKGMSTQEIMKHIIILGSADYPVFLFKKTPFAIAKSLLLFRSAFVMPWYDPSSSYFPHINSDSLNVPLMNLAKGSINYKQIVQIVANKGYDIGTVTDLSPFFYKFNNGVPQAVRIVFYASLFILSCVLLVPLVFAKTVALIYRKKYFNSDIGTNKSTIYKLGFFFLLIGIGFMTAEVTFIQRFMLFLGPPTLSMSTVLSTLLLSAALGSLTSQKFSFSNLKLVLGWASFIVSVCILLYILSLTWIFSVFITQTLFVRVCITILLLFPVGFLMGFPFPLLIQILKKIKLENMIPLMICINGASSVLASAVSIITAMKYNFSGSLLLSSLCYFLIFISFIPLAHRKTKRYRRTAESDYVF